MSVLEEMDVFQIIICPECGGSEFVTIRGRPLQVIARAARCKECGLYFFADKMDISVKGANTTWKTIYAAKGKSFTLDEWEWKILFFTDGDSGGWHTYSKKIRDLRTDKRSLNELVKLMSDKFGAHQVTLSLTSNFKR
jgi:hypothetical protein